MGVQESSYVLFLSRQQGGYLEVQVLVTDLVFWIDEFALFKTYAIPSISSLLIQTGEICNLATAAKRGEDTGTIFCEMISCPLDSKRCKAAIARMSEY